MLHGTLGDGISWAATTHRYFLVAYTQVDVNVVATLRTPVPVAKYDISTPDPHLCQCVGTHHTAALGPRVCVCVCVCVYVRVPVF